MPNIPSPSPKFALSVAAFWFFALSQAPLPGFLSSAAAQTGLAVPAASPVVPTAQPSVAVPSGPVDASTGPASGTADTDVKGRHLAPHDTFYLLTYVSAKTDDGVEGFDPGQEVHVVAVHRQTHTLVVSDGHAQVEVPPSDLTNDLDIATLVRQRDKAKQERISAYIEAEKAAYNRAQQQAAAATAKDLQQRQQAQAAALSEAEQVPAQQTEAPVEAAENEGNGYYGEGGFGYGSPYEYFVDAPRGDRSREHGAAPAPVETREQGVVQAPAAAGRPR